MATRSSDEILSSPHLGLILFHLANSVPFAPLAYWEQQIFDGEYGDDERVKQARTERERKRLIASFARTDFHVLENAGCVQSVAVRVPRDGFSGALLQNFWWLDPARMPARIYKLTKSSTYTLLPAEPRPADFAVAVKLLALRRQAPLTLKIVRFYVSTDQTPQTNTAYGRKWFGQPFSPDDRRQVMAQLEAESKRQEEVLADEPAVRDFFSTSYTTPRLMMIDHLRALLLVVSKRTRHGTPDPPGVDPSPKKPRITIAGTEWEPHAYTRAKSILTGQRLVTIARYWTPPLDEERLLLLHRSFVENYMNDECIGYSLL